MNKKEIKEILLNESKKGRKEQDAVFGEIPYEKRIEIVQWLFAHLNSHIDGGSYRYLIYVRLGFDQKQYTAFYPYGMNISNALNSARDR